MTKPITEEGTLPQNHLAPNNLGAFQMIALSLILASPDNARRDWESDSAKEKLDELARSINESGLLQPIVVRPTIHDNKDKFLVIAGERRLRACRSLGWEEIPAVVRDSTGEDALIASLVENMQRSDLNAIERAAGLAQVLARIPDLTEEELGRRVSKSQSWIANQLRLLTLPSVVCDLIRAGKLTGSHGAALVSVAKISPDKAVDIAADAVRFSWSSGMVEDAALEFTTEHRAKEAALQPSLPGTDSAGAGKTTTKTTTETTKTEPPKPASEVKENYTPGDAKREFEESQKPDADVPPLSSLPTPPAEATGAAAPAPKATGLMGAATDPAAPTGKTVGVHIDQRWDDWLFENNLDTVDHALEQLVEVLKRASELDKRPQLTPLAHKCLKALASEEQSLAERLEDILVGRARTEGIDIDTLNEIPE